MRKKIIPLIVIIIILSSLCNSQASYAPDQLELIKGSYVHGRISVYSFEYDSTFTVQDIFKPSDVNKNLVQINRTYSVLSAPSEIGFITGMVFQRHHVIWEHNRSIAIPEAYYKITNGSYSVSFSLLDYDTFDQMNNINNSIIDLGDGRIVGWNELLLMSALRYEVLYLISYVTLDWEFFNYIPEKTQYAISPEAVINDTIDYGWYYGEIVSKIPVSINSRNYEALKCHVPRTSSPYVYIPEGSGRSRVIHDTDFFYDQKSGLLLKFQEYNETGHLIRYFEPDHYYLSYSDGGNTFTISMNFLLIPLSLSFFGYMIYFIRRKRKK